MEADKNLWSRRKFSKAIVSAQLLIASGMLGIPFGCTTDSSSEKRALDDKELKLLAVVMDEIIPANDKMPSASNMGGVSYIQGMIGQDADLLKLFKLLLKKIDTLSYDKFSDDFIKIARDQRIVVLENLEQKDTKLFNVLKEFTYEGYYTNEQVYKLINYEPHPTGTRGPDMEPFDEKLLDRVRNQPSSYINI